ncbi:MAG: hypothetical protein ABFD81_07075 [Syntrophaceae bacterium]
MKDLHSNIDIVSVLDPVVVSATATHTDIDLAGFNSAELFIWLGLDAGSGLGESNYLTFTLYDSADGTTYAVVETADVLGAGTITSGVILTVDSTDEDNTLYHFGYVGGKRYLQLVVTETGTVSCPMAIGVVKGHPLDTQS